MMVKMETNKEKRQVLERVEKNVQEVVQISLEVDMTDVEVMIVLNIGVAKEVVEAVEIEVVGEKEVIEEVEVVGEKEVIEEVEVVGEEEVIEKVEVVGEVDEVVEGVGRYRCYGTSALLWSIHDKEEYILFAEKPEKAHTTLVVVYAPLSSKRGFWSVVLTSCWFYLNGACKMYLKELREEMKFHIYGVVYCQINKYAQHWDNYISLTENALYALLTCHVSKTESRHL